MLGFLGLLSVPFLIFEKGMSKKIASVFLGFVNVLFSVFEKGISKKLR